MFWKSEKLDIYGLHYFYRRHKTGASDDFRTLLEKWFKRSVDSHIMIS